MSYTLVINHFDLLYEGFQMMSTLYDENEKIVRNIFSMFIFDFDDTYDANKYNTDEDYDIYYEERDDYEEKGEQHHIYLIMRIRKNMNLPRDIIYNIDTSELTPKKVENFLFVKEILKNYLESKYSWHNETIPLKGGKRSHRTRKHKKDKKHKKSKRRRHTKRRH
jgi:hypothetical protein